MSNPWDGLATELLGTLKTSISDFVDQEKPELEAFLKEKAQDLAKQTWITVDPNAVEADKSIARENIRHLKAQVILEAADLKIVATARAVGLLSKVFETVGNFLIQYGPKILAAL
jgi:hypothetical protein